VRNKARARPGPLNLLMTFDKQLGISAVWLFAALAIVFAPAMDGPEVIHFERLALTETLGPRILAPSADQAVAQDDRPAKLVTHATTTLQGLLVFVALPVALLAAAVVAHSQSAVLSELPGSHRSSRGPPTPAS
jgi:hypothetical protein